MSENEKDNSKFEDRTGKRWTTDEEALLFDLRSWHNLPFRVIALRLCRNQSSCEKKYRSTNWTLKSFYDPSKCRLKENFKRALGEHIAELNDAKIKSKILANEVLADRLVETVKALPKVNKKVFIPSKKRMRQKHLPEDVGLAFSDTHIGHHHTFEETGGISEYNFDIFKKRIEFIKKAMADIVELHSKLYELPNLHIFCPGDIVAGMNAAGQWSATYINMPVLDQAVAGADAIADMIYYWLGLFKDIYFYGVMGNHGRCANKGIEKEYVNWDYLSYKFLEARLKDNPRVHFNIPKAWWILTEIRNHKFLVMHGDDMRGGTKAIEPATERMASIIGKIPDYTIAGHFHNACDFSTNFGRVIINGSFLGSDVFSLKTLRKASRPEQKLFGIHDRRGITWTYNLDLSIAR